MNTRRRRLIIVANVFLCVLIQPVQANPNHLEPIVPYAATRYGSRQAIFTALLGNSIGKERPVLWMIEWPTFSLPAAVILRHEIEYDPNDDRPYHVRRVKREEWLVAHAALKTPRWKTRDDGSKALDIKPAEDVETHRTSVTKDFAEAVRRAWLSTLQLTRYAEDRSLGLDGTTFEFHCDYNYSGQTWSPDSGLPAMLVDLGGKLRAIAQSDEKSKGRG